MAVGLKSFLRALVMLDEAEQSIAHAGHVARTLADPDKGLGQPATTEHLLEVLQTAMAELKEIGLELKLSVLSANEAAS